MHLDREGPRPRAAPGVVRAATPTVLAYMDVDLSTDLAALLPLVAPLLSGHCDLAIGTRLARGVARRARPEARAHLALLQPDPAHDAARRGSPTRSAASRRSAPTSRRELLPLVEDTGWFFDTELLVLAERAGPAHPRGAGRLGRRPRLARRHRGHRDGRPPRHRARWARGLASGRIALAALRGRTTSTSAYRRGLLPQLVRFAVVGVLSTLAYLAALPRCCAGRWARSGRTPPRCCSPRSATPPSTAASPSASAVAPTASATSCRVSSSSPSASTLTAGSLAVLHALAPDASRAARGERARAGQPRRHAPALPALPLVGVLLRPRRLRPPTRPRPGPGRDRPKEPAMTTVTPGTEFVPPIPVDDEPEAPRSTTTSPTASGTRAQVAPSSASRVRRLWRGQESDPAWVRPSLLALLFSTGVLYLWGLRPPAGRTRSTPRPCRPAARTGRRSSSGRRTPPTSSPSTSPRPRCGSMGLSVKLFGLSSWSILVPQALMGVATVGLLYLAVRRWCGRGRRPHRRRGARAHAGRRR